MHYDMVDIHANHIMILFNSVWNQARIFINFLFSLNLCSLASSPQLMLSTSTFLRFLSKQATITTSCKLFCHLSKLRTLSSYWSLNSYFCRSFSSPWLISFLHYYSSSFPLNILSNTSSNHYSTIHCPIKSMKILS